jgi:hypothetical protein
VQGSQGAIGPQGPTGPVGAGFPGLQVYCIGAGDFLPQATGDGLQMLAAQGDYGTFVDNGNDVQVFGEVRLPNGATITKIHYYGYDADANKDLSIRIGRQDMNVGGSWTSPVSFVSSSAPGRFYASKGASILVDNDSKCLWLMVEVSGGNGNWPTDGSLAVRAVVLEYTL